MKCRERRWALTPSSVSPAHSWNYLFGVGTRPQLCSCSWAPGSTFCPAQLACPSSQFYQPPTHWLTIHFSQSNSFSSKAVLGGITESKRSGIFGSVRWPTPFIISCWDSCSDVLLLVLGTAHAICTHLLNRMKNAANCNHAAGWHAKAVISLRAHSLVRSGILTLLTEAKLWLISHSSSLKAYHQHFLHCHFKFLLQGERREHLQKKKILFRKMTWEITFFFHWLL